MDELGFVVVARDIVARVPPSSMAARLVAPNNSGLAYIYCNGRSSLD